MYAEQFSSGNTGLASAIAMVLLLAAIPVLLANRAALRREDSAV
jgi:ABC-type sugar transport system permease subunit